MLAQFSTVTPVGDRLYVKLGAEEQASAGGILLPSSAVSRSNEGQVVSVGKDVTLAVGDQVMYAKYSGTEITSGEEDFVLLKQDDVIGVMPSANVADLKPTGDKVLLRIIKPAQESKGGIMLGSNTEMPSIGKVPHPPPPHTPPLPRPSSAAAASPLPLPGTHASHQNASGETFAAFHDVSFPRCLHCRS